MMRLRRRFSKGNLLLLIPAAICAPLCRQMDFLWLEAMLLALALAAVAIAGDRLTWDARPPGWCAFLRRWSRNGAIACLLPAIGSVVLRLSLLPWVPIPHPVVPDEFSHSLLAKTFLLGRLANPPHPLWEHFESIHIISQPTYSSMYMAGQACFLAAGQVLFGNLFWGVLLSTALFCAALTWFLRAYVPPGWALFGGLLAAVRIGGSYWNDSYWGGSAGALGGALVLGAYPRLVKTWKPLPAIVFAAGLVILANTRPYEGAVLGLVVSLAILNHLWRNRQAGKIPWRRMTLCLSAIVIVLGVSGWAMTRQWKAVTGAALTLPYRLNQETYGWPLTLPWLPVRTVSYRHPALELYHEFEVDEHRRSTELSQMPVALLVKFSVWWRFFFGITLSGVFLFTRRILSAPRTRFVWMAGGVVSLAVITEQSGYPHYWSPVAPVMFLFLVEGLRHLAQFRLGSVRFGPAVVRLAIPMLCALLVAHAASTSASRESAANFTSNLTPNFTSWCCTEVAMKDREPLVRRLESLPGEQLVFVTYKLTDYETIEWVYNEPDIDRAKIVFARDMGAAKNQELLRYYPRRHAWHVTVEKDRAATLEPM